MLILVCEKDGENLLTIAGYNTAIKKYLKF